MLTGTSANDTLNGGAGDDTLDGGAGNNTLIGGTGNDSYIVDALTDGVSEGLAAGTDTVVASLNYTLGANVENLELTGSALNGTGNTLANILTGNSGNNTLSGLAGNDQLIGGAGQDTVTGGTENDRIVMQVTAGDVDIADGGAGSDTLALVGTVGGNGVMVVDLSSLTDQVTSIGGTPEALVQKNFEHLDASGLGSSVHATGSGGANLMIGSNGTDQLTGNGGNDVFLIGAAADHGGSEVINGGAGTDVIRFTSTTPAETLILAAGVTAVESVVIGTAAGITTGTTASNVDASNVVTALTITGNAGANVLTGTSANDTLNGGAGDDTLDGGAGNNTLIGGTGNDSYIVDALTDGVSEGLAAGTDTVVASLNYTLGANVENLELTGSALNGTGNTLANILTGNSGNNTLSGLAGNDQLIGGDGNDTLLGGDGRDTVQGGAGDDVVLLASAAQFATGELIDGGADTDTLRYTGTVAATLMLTAGVTNIEQVQIANVAGLTTGLAAINVNAAAVTNGLTLTGNNGANNVLTGTALRGHAGNDSSSAGRHDILSGGNGNDILIWDPADASLEGGAGTDRLRIDGGGMVVDLTVVPDNVITDIEVITLTGSGNNTLTLGPTDVLALSSTTDTLRVDGNAGDIVSTSDQEWLRLGNVTIGAQTYAQYSKSGALLQVDTDINRSTIGLFSPQVINLINLSSLNGNNGFKLSGVAAGDESGFSVSTAGDVNGDGFADLLIGARYADPNGTDSGASYVVFGKASGFGANLNLSTLDGTNGFQLSGVAAGDESGLMVSTAGDVNGDGFADLLIGACYADPHGSSSGASYVVFGKASGFGANLNLSALDGTNGFQLSGEAAGDESGFSVSTAGDVNGDGFADLLISAHHADPHGSSSGASYVVFGKASGFGANLNLSALDGTNGFQLSGEAAGDESGYSVSTAGDVNGDGFADLLIGAHRADPNGTDSGASYVVFGKASGFGANLNLSALNGSNGFQISGEVAGDRFARGLSTAGDVNGDGFADLLINATHADPHGSNSGASYVVFGKASGFGANLNLSALNGSNGFQISGVVAGDESGFSVSTAGDVNGDGFADLLISATHADPHGSNSGASYVVFGKASGFGANLNLSALDGTNGFQLWGVAAGDESGFSVSTAGDVNGDGFADLLIGAHRADPHGSSSGASYLVFGFNMGKVDFPGTSGDDTLTGSSDANILIGGLGNDTLNGGVGNDRLAGGLGNDIYQINRGDGQDTISDNDSTLVNSDKLLYGASINPLDLVLSRQVNDLRIALHGTAESVTIDNWYANPTTAQVETIQAGNGQTLLSTQVDQLIQAMAGFTQQTGLSWDAASGGAGDPGQQAQFQGIIAENWQ